MQRLRPHPIERAPTDIAWRDLTGLQPHETVREILLPLPWLAASIALYASPLPLLGLAASFMFFLCALRLNHEAIHNNLALPRKADFIIMHILSAMMLGSNSAEAYCHLVHHKHTGSDQDHEGKCAHMPWWQVLLYGPKFPADIVRAAWHAGGPKWRKRMRKDALCVALLLAAIMLINHPALYAHLGAMLLAQSLAAFFAVWITHQGTGESLAGRSQRGPLAKAAYLMFYHREHHLFPKVPVRKLPLLANRLDTQSQGYANTRVPVVPWLDTHS